MKDLVTAAERLDAGKSSMKGGGAKCHRVGVVDHPRLRAVFPGCLRKPDVFRDGPQGAQDATRTGGVTHRLQQAETLWYHEIGIAHRNRAWLGGNDHEVSAPQRFGQSTDGPDGEARNRFLPGLDMLRHGHVFHGSHVINVVEIKRALQGATKCQIGHEIAGPVAGATANVGDFDGGLGHGRMKPRGLTRFGGDGEMPGPVKQEDDDR